ncbi:MAG: hypothetical protein NTX61_14620 [Bacteroidetes bacterium]|nr:hypothetical protein [Bacteroidota bacterium]
MKKLQILLILFVFIMSKSVTANPLKVGCPVPGPVITFDFDFNSKKSDCQMPFGFCRFSVSVKWENRPTGGNSIKGNAFINEQNQLIIIVKESDLKTVRNGLFYNYLKDRNSITIDDTYPLSPEVNRALEAKYPIVIKPGDYKVIHENNEIRIVIPV